MSPWYSNISSRVGDVISSAELVSGSLRDSLRVEAETPLENFDDPRHNLTNGEFLDAPHVLEEGKLYYEWISPAWRDIDEFTGDKSPGPRAG